MRRVLLAAVACAATLVHAEDDWGFAAAAYWNAPREGDGYASAIVTADRAALHLEGRANYEAIHAQSLFIGWSFEFGEQVKVMVRPIAGFVGNSLRGPIAGFEASASAGKWDYYIETEYVHDQGDKSASYTYAWSELGFRPVEPLRIGIVGQRTRIYGGDRDYQGGGLAQLTLGKATLGAYWFNPASSNQVVIVSLGASF
jgi:hypothetical protein